MPTLSNPRHEAFAQARAAGQKQHDAYVNAGFGGNPSAASQVEKRPEVSARIQELVVERQTTLRAEEGEDDDSISTVDRDWIVRQLKKNVSTAQGAGEIGHANKAIELLMGMHGFGKKTAPGRALEETPEDDANTITKDGHLNTAIEKLERLDALTVEDDA